MFNEDYAPTHIIVIGGGGEARHNFPKGTKVRLVLDDGSAMKGYEDEHGLYQWVPDRNVVAI